MIGMHAMNAGRYRESTRHAGQEEQSSLDTYVPSVLGRCSLPPACAFLTSAPTSQSIALHRPIFPCPVGWILTRPAGVPAPLLFVLSFSCPLSYSRYLPCHTIQSTATVLSSPPLPRSPLSPSHGPHRRPRSDDTPRSLRSATLQQPEEDGRQTEESEKRRNARWLTTTAGFTRSSPTITAAPSSFRPSSSHPQSTHSEPSTPIHPIPSYQSTDPTASPAQTALIHSVATPQNATRSCQVRKKHYLIILVIVIKPRSDNPPDSRDSTQLDFSSPTLHHSNSQRMLDATQTHASTSTRRSTTGGDRH